MKFDFSKMKAIFRMWPITDIEALGCEMPHEKYDGGTSWGSSVKTMCFQARG